MNLEPNRLGFSSPELENITPIVTAEQLVTEDVEADMRLEAALDKRDRLVQEY